ncbi:uncharacterized protein LOC114543791 [Dendronephthya gigantea]|uniref:uncharacterized protein LOC114543791 n=1 Tax=Dendronephthya gigantea TaxID=151771 RepID=UPI00106AF621|nr:uncharacterized protein LOC114543791 [Dendronephthya gigantea]XP_028418445.1 uncharacterized protein LOC114543791 [Dendronephthya gigantea]
MSHTQGRGYNVGSYPNQPGQGGHSTYNESFSNFAYNSRNVGLDYGVNYPQSYETEQIHHGGSSSYHRGGGQPYSAQPHPGGQVYPMANTNRAPKTLDTRKEHLKSEITANLAAALGDLTKLVHDEEDASVALHVSNALTESLLKYRMSGLQ